MNQLMFGLEPFFLQYWKRLTSYQIIKTQNSGPLPESLKYKICKVWNKEPFNTSIETLEKIRAIWRPIQHTAARTGLDWRRTHRRRSRNQERQARCAGPPREVHCLWTRQANRLLPYAARGLQWRSFPAGSHLGRPQRCSTHVTPKHFSR